MVRLLLLPAALLLTAPAFAAPDISVAAAPNGAGWDITLSPAIADTVTGKIWLVIDGKSKMINTGDFFAEDVHKPLRFQAKADSDLDGKVKQILTAQGLATKPDMTTYFISYTLNGFGRITVPETLHFRTKQYADLYALPPNPATYKLGDRITLFGLVALSEGITVPDIGLPRGVFVTDVPKPTETFSDTPTASASEGKVHRIYIQVQFVPKPADKK